MFRRLPPAVVVFVFVSSSTKTRQRTLLCSFASSAPSSSWLSTPGNPVMRWPSLPDANSTAGPHDPPQLSQPPPPLPSSSDGEQVDGVVSAASCAKISHLLRTVADPSEYDNALRGSGVAPSVPLLRALLRAGDLRSSALFALSRWARPHLTPSLLTSFVDGLAKARAFDSAWFLILDHSPAPLSAFACLFRRYARAELPSAAIRTFNYIGNHPEAVVLDDDVDPFELLMDALCKEGQTRAAAELLARRKKEAVVSPWLPSVRIYNMLLHGWFRSRKLRKAELLWDKMRQEGVRPTVVSYGTLIEGLCRMRRPEQAIALLEEMRASGTEANTFTCNPIVDALAEDGRFKEALGMLEKFPLYGVSPNISTFNSLVKGFCKNGDLVGASKVLKMMIGRGILPMDTTYNYFFGYFVRFRKVEEAMNLYKKMIESGYSPNRLSYQLLIKLLCEEKKLDLAVQLIREMNRNGFNMDLATSTMLVHLLCRMHKLDEACMEFESMIRRGITPQYITYRMLAKELKKWGMVELDHKIANLMDSVPHSTKLPGSYREREGDMVIERRKSIMKKAQVMSDALKTCKDPKELSKLKSSSERTLESANMLISSIRRRVYTVQNGRETYQESAVLSRGAENI